MAQYDRCPYKERGDPTKGGWYEGTARRPRVVETPRVAGSLRTRGPAAPELPSSALLTPGIASLPEPAENGLCSLRHPVGGSLLRWPSDSSTRFQRVTGCLCGVRARTGHSLSSVELGAA